MSRSTRVNLTGLGVGTAFGFLIQAAGFGDADFIHRMLLFQNWYPWEVFGSAIAVGVPAFWLLERRKWVTPLGGQLKLNRTSIKPRQVYGGLLFGTGWAFSTTCPVPAMAMVAGGGVLGLAVVAGLFAGILIGDRVAEGRGHKPAPTVASQPAVGVSGG
jgi:uncharacterized membrane protein YedE/YeeE